MTIFPIPQDPFVDKSIASRCDIQSQLNLLQVNRAAPAALDNEDFKKLFAAKHPRLAGSPFVFQVLKTFHPDKCWKVACWVLGKPYRQMTNLNFLKEAPLQLPRLAEMKNQEFRRICGSRYEDPESPIHLAWIAKENYRSVFEQSMQIREFLMHIREKVIPSVTYFVNQLSPEDQMQAHEALQLFLPHLEEFHRFWGQCPLEDLSVELLKDKLRSSESYTRLLEHNIVVYDDAVLLSLCEARQFIALHENFLEIHSKYFKLDQDYRALEMEKDRALRHQREIAQDLALFPGHGAVTTLAQKIWLLEQYDLMVDEVEYARDIEALGFDDVPRLENCVQVIKGFLVGIVANPDAGLPDIHSEEIQELRRSINSLPMSGRIWHNLYTRYAGGVDGPQWSENHFHEYLGVLCYIIGSLELSWISSRQDLLREGITPQNGLYFQGNYRHSFLLPRGEPAFHRSPHIPIDPATLLRLATLKCELLNQLCLHSGLNYFVHLIQTQPEFGPEFIGTLE